MVNSRAPIPTPFIKTRLGVFTLGSYESKALTRTLSPDSHFSFDSANHRVASDAFIYAGWKALKALRRSTPNG